MKSKIMATLGLVAVALFSSAAMAATETKTGEVKTTDVAKHQLSLASGETFEVGSHVKLDKVKVGEKVTITFESKNGKMEASKIVPAK
jgi:Cu/Ag efflux protein CusF